MKAPAPFKEHFTKFHIPPSDTSERFGVFYEVFDGSGDLTVAFALPTFGQLNITDLTKSSALFKIPKGCFAVVDVYVAKILVDGKPVNKFFFDYEVFNSSMTAGLEDVFDRLTAKESKDDPPHPGFCPGDCGGINAYYGCENPLGMHYDCDEDKCVDNHGPRRDE